MGAATFLLLAGGLIVLAYLSESLLVRLRVPPVLLLVLVGLALGPVSHALPPERFLAVAPHFGSLAFLLILFEGGLDLSLASLRRDFRAGWQLALVGLALSVVLATVFLLACGRPWREGLLLAVALSPVSGSIVLPLLGRLPVNETLRTVATLEAALADVVALLGMETLLTLMHRGGWGSLLALGSFFAAAVSVGVAVLAGLLWPPLLRQMAGVPHADVLTFAWAMLLWGAAEQVGAPGALAVLAFGVTIANEGEVLGLLKWGGHRAGELVETTVAQLHRFIQQLTFLVRTFFFVFLGVVVTGEGLGWQLLLLTFGLAASLLLARYGAVFRLRSFASKFSQGERLLLWLVQPRGLVSAVLALRAVEEGFAGPWFFPAVSGVIVLTNALLVVALRKLPEAGEAAR